MTVGLKGSCKTSGAAATILEDEARLRIASDTSLGAGNFLYKALQANPLIHEPLLYLEETCHAPDGKSYQSLSLADLARISDLYAGWYWAQGVRAHDPVAIYRDDGVEYLLHHLALTRIGAISVLTNGNMDSKIAAEHFLRVGAVGCFFDLGHLNGVKPYIDSKAFRFLATDGDLKDKVCPELPHEAIYSHQADDPIMIAHSSGTTGVPKPVLLQHEKFFHGVRYRLKVPRVPGGERILSSLPHSHNCAIAYIMLALLSGTPVMIASDHSGLGVLRQIHSFKPSMVVSFPQTYVELTEQDLARYDLRSVSLWFNGGDAAHEPHIRKLVALGTVYRDGKLEPGSLFIDGMGSSEMGFSLFRHLHTSTSNHYGRCIGRPLEWVDAAVLAEDGNKVPSLQVGRLGVKAPSVTTGYWNNSNLTYRSKLSGYWLTGDLAYQDDSGFFYHVDRVPDPVLTSQGIVYSLETEELLLSIVEQVSDCSIISVPTSDGGHVAAALVRLHSGKRINKTRVLAELNEKLAIKGRGSVAQLQIAVSSEVPLGTTGKVLKRRLREQFAKELKRAPSRKRKLDRKTTFPSESGVLT